MDIEKVRELRAGVEGTMPWKVLEFPTDNEYRRKHPEWTVTQGEPRYATREHPKASRDPWWENDISLIDDRRIADFIAAAPEAIDFLLEEIRWLRETIDVALEARGRKA